MINNFAPVTDAVLFKGLLFKWLEGSNMQDILNHASTQMLLISL